jgi:hypothetical protein
MQQRQVDVSMSLISNGEPAVAVQPGQRALYHPAVLAQPVAAVHSLTCYTALDASPVQRPPALLVIITLVCMHLVRSLAWESSRTFGSANRLDPVHKLLKHLGVVSVGRGKHHREGDTFGFDHNMALRAGHPLGVAFIRWIRTGCFVPRRSERVNSVSSR